MLSAKTGCLYFITVFFGSLFYFSPLSTYADSVGNGHSVVLGLHESKDKAVFGAFLQELTVQGRVLSIPKCVP